MKENSMPNNTPPSDWNAIFTLIWVMAISFWGGTVHTIRKIKDGTIARFTLSEWVGDVVISGFIGVITYSLCRYSGFDEWLTAACIGISSHQGTRGLLFIERLIADRIGK
jgi:hypothetical protein